MARAFKTTAHLLKRSRQWLRIKKVYCTLGLGSLTVAIASG
jgi:hypothetical protein